MPPHFHAMYADKEAIVSIEELRENWELAKEKQELFAIEPLK